MNKIYTYRYKYCISTFVCSKKKRKSEKRSERGDKDSQRKREKSKREKEGETTLNDPTKRPLCQYYKLAAVFEIDTYFRTPDPIMNSKVHFVSASDIEHLSIYKYTIIVHKFWRPQCKQTEIEYFHQ